MGFASGDRLLTYPNMLGKRKLLLFSLVLLASAGLLLGLLSCASPDSLSSPATSSEAKVFIEEDGIYVLSYAAVEEAGLDLDEVDPGNIQLFNQGQEVPIAFSGQGRELAILFYGEANTSLYSRRNVYRLSLGGGAGRRMVERAGASAPRGELPASFLDTVHREEDLFYGPKVAPGASHWHWESLRAPASSTFAITLPQVAPGDGTLRLALLGYTSDAANPDHHLRIDFNDCAVEDAWWDGQSEYLIEAPLAHSCLREGENLLTLEAVADTGAQADIVLVDWFEVDYQRFFVATDDRLEFIGQGGPHNLAGFTGEEISLFDVSDPRNVVLIADATVERGRQKYTLSFVDEELAGQRYVAVGPTGFREPAVIAAATQSTDLRSPDNQADYIIVTHEAFQQAIQPLVEWRRGQGLTVRVVTITEVYDQFTYGLVDPAALRELLRYVHRYWAKPAPQYVLLVGDASYDYRDDLQGPNKNLLAPYLVETALGGQTTSDNWFVSLDDDDILPDMAIGRLPVRTVEEAGTVVGKIIAYERNAPAGGWRQRVLLVADGEEATFAQHSDVLANEWVPRGYEVVKVYAASTEEPQTEIVSQLRQGSLIVNYVGHGSIDLWSHEALFSSDQITSLDNDGRQPLMVMMSCLLGFFAHPELDSMAEELLLARDGGAVGVFAPSSLTLSIDQEPLNQALFDALLVREVPTVGLAIMEVKRSLAFETQDQRDVIETFTLLGDPALRLASP
jgi:hypothetical protein